MAQGRLVRVLWGALSRHRDGTAIASFRLVCCRETRQTMPRLHRDMSDGRRSLTHLQPLLPFKWQQRDSGSFPMSLGRIPVRR